MTWRLLAATLLGLALATPAESRAVTDCPLRDLPFSERSPLIDILLSPPARGVVERAFGTGLDRGPAMFTGTTPPTFAAILTLRDAATFMRQPDEAIARADAALRALPVTARDRIARCARYDNDRPVFDLPPGRPRILLFEKINGFKDVPGFDAAHRMFVDLARREGWAIVATDKGGAMNPATLRQFDVVVWNNVSGDVLTIAQRRAFRRYVERGGAFIGVHGTAGDPAYFWDWFVDGLIGARFAGHPVGKQFQQARIAVEGEGPLTAGLPRTWTMTDEWYSFSTNPRAAKARIVATLDERTYTPEGFAGQRLRMGDHPIAWARCVGRGRMFYSAIGHRPESYDRGDTRQLIANAVTWATRPTPCIAP